MSSAIKLPNAEEITLAKLSSQKLSAVIESDRDSQTLNVIDKQGRTYEVTLPMSAYNFMIELHTQFGQGNAVKITPIHAELTTQEGADLLNISRPTFIKLLDTKVTPSYSSGNSGKVAFGDVIKYKAFLEAERLSTLDELSSLDQELDLGY